MNGATALAADARLYHARSDQMEWAFASCNTERNASAARVTCNRIAPTARS